MHDSLELIQSEFDNQLEWIKILLRGKIMLPCVSNENIILITRKMNPSDREEFLVSCKWIYGLLREDWKSIQSPSSEVSFIKKLSSDTLPIFPRAEINRQPIPYSLPIRSSQESQEEWIERANNCLQIRKQWIEILRRGKFILEGLEDENLRQVISKMDLKSLTRTMRTSKWMNEFIGNKRHTFSKLIKSHLLVGGVCSMQLVDESEFERIAHCRLLTLGLNDLTSTVFNKLLFLTKKYNISVEKIIADNILLTQDVFTVLKPRVLLTREVTQFAEKINLDKVEKVHVLAVSKYEKFYSLWSVMKSLEEQDLYKTIDINDINSKQMKGFIKKNLEILKKRLATSPSFKNYNFSFDLVNLNAHFDFLPGNDEDTHFIIHERSKGKTKYSISYAKVEKAREGLAVALALLNRYVTKTKETEYCSLQVFHCENMDEFHSIYNIFVEQEREDWLKGDFDGVEEEEKKVDNKGFFKTKGLIHLEKVFVKNYE